MKKIVIAALLLVAAFNGAVAQSHRNRHRSEPDSQPEKHIYVGQASSENILNMYNEALMFAFRRFIAARKLEEWERTGKVSEDVKGTCTIELLKSEIWDDATLYIWFEIKPGGKYIYEATFSFNSESNSKRSEERGIDCCNLTISADTGETVVKWSAESIAKMSCMPNDNGSVTHSAKVGMNVLIESETLLSAEEGRD